MSTKSKIAVGASCVFAVGMIIYDFYRQEWIRLDMRRNIVQDQMRSELRKQQNLQNLQKQMYLEAEYKKAIQQESNT